MNILGLDRAEVAAPNEFNIYTREAGAGAIKIGIEGPSKADIDCKDRSEERRVGEECRSRWAP